MRPLDRPILLHAVVIALCVAFGAGISYSQGQDINFDQMNYHYYAPFAYETQRLGLDVAPAQVMHSFFSPFVYLPFYYMVRTLPPRMVGLGLGAMHGLNLWLVFIIARIVARRLPQPARWPATLAAVVMSGAGPMAISELGTSMADLLISLPVLAGLALLLRARFADGRMAPTVMVIGLAGAFVGAAASLKLTAASYAMGLLVASAVGWTTWRHRLIALLAAGGGIGIGFVAVGGYWYLLMWRRFGNPVFPYFNTIFRSPDFPSGKALFDAHYIPHSILQALSYPFLWTQIQETTTEAPFRDIRFVLLIVLGVIALGSRLLMRGRSRAATEPLERRLLVFIVVAFCVWIDVWSIQRYLVPLELAMGPAIIVLLRWTGCFDAARGRALSITAASLAALCAATVRAPDWAHLGWRATWLDVNPPATSGAHPIYFLAGEPLGYVVPSLPPGSAAIDVVPWEDISAWGDTVFLRRIHALLSDPRYGPVWSVSLKPLTDSFRKTIAQYGLKPSGRCETTRGRPMPLNWCVLERVPPSG
jgi:hypothetical protein